MNDRDKERLTFALEILQRHRARLDAAISAVRLVEYERPGADLASASAKELLAKIRAEEIATVARGLGIQEGEGSIEGDKRDECALTECAGSLATGQVRPLAIPGKSVSASALSSDLDSSTSVSQPTGQAPGVTE